SAPEAITLGPPTATFAVNDTSDTPDLSPGDGVCLNANGLCSLRAAVMEANALPGNHTISVPTGTYRLTIAGADEDGAAAGDLDITNDLRIQGAGSASTIIDGGALDRVFQIQPGVKAILADLSIQNGNAHGGNGGA